MTACETNAGSATAARRRILGIDPGSRVTGYGLVELDGRKITHLAHGCIRCGTTELAARLQEIHAGLEAVIGRQQPDEAAIESVFVRRNVNSALVLGHARGVALLTLAEAGLSVREYAPAQVKSAIVGNGRADKHQIQYLVRAVLELTQTPQSDAADALAIALCHARMRNTPLPVQPRRRPTRGVGYKNHAGGYTK